MNKALRLHTSNRRSISPLRYPGGKSVLAKLFTNIITELGISSATYVEPYAGGVGAGLILLKENIVEKLAINDIDPAVYAFWNAITNRNEKFVNKLSSTELSIEEWTRQREIYKQPSEVDQDELAFAFFYLNRTNRSGILTGGVIGGLNQTGNYKLDARFNRETLINRIKTIGELKDRIDVTNLDGREVIKSYANNTNAFLYVDPPYVNAGTKLYLNSFDGRDHISLSECIKNYQPNHWLVTYDMHEMIKTLYSSYFQTTLRLKYSATSHTVASELVIASSSVAEILKKI